MIKVEALQSFEHSGARKPGDRFQVSDRHAADLSRRGMVRVLDGKLADPPPAGGEPSSASPAAPASPQTTAKPSGAGGKKRGRKKKAPEASS